MRHFRATYITRKENTTLRVIYVAFVIPLTERRKQNFYTDKVENQSLYAEESREQKAHQYQTVIRWITLGQYEDMETGLYYNWFRYYSPSDGCYIQTDPIGLAGGNPTLYGYVSDVNKFVDPLGLLPLTNPINQGHHMVPHSLATYLGIVPYNSQTGVPGLYFSGTQWSASGGLNHSAMHGYNGIGANTKPVLTQKEFVNSGMTSEQWLKSLEEHYNNPQIQHIKGDLYIINSDGTKGNLLKENVTPSEAWNETKKWAENQKGQAVEKICRR